jgi:hypothetical protein
MKVTYKGRTVKVFNGFLSIVERWEIDAHGIPIKSQLVFRELTPTRSSAYNASRRALRRVQAATL